MFTIPPLTSDILAVNLDAAGSPSIKIRLSQKASGTHAYGWGFGWYPDDQQSVMIAKDPAARGTQVMVDAITEWSNFRSTVFFCKVRGASQGYSHTETQPFSRSFAGRDWMFMHNGDLEKSELLKLHGSTSSMFEPLGKTDSELAFCILLERIQATGSRSLAAVDPAMMHTWFQTLDALGSADMYITDGECIVCFHGSRSPKQLYHTRLQPPDNLLVYESEAADITLSDPRDMYRTAFVVSSTAFALGEWKAMQPGQLIVARRGIIVWDSAPEHEGQVCGMRLPPLPPQAQQPRNFMSPMQMEQAQRHVVVTNARNITHTPDGEPLAFRTFEVRHTTHYTYSEPVQHSTHIFRLQPLVDALQEVVHSSLLVSSMGEEIRFDDVFDNHSLHYTIDTPYSQLSIEAISRVKVFASPPDDHSLSLRRTTIPLAWMPWQRQMMTPYLLPNELPETQLTELTEYAMSFVERNDYRLLATLQDINNTIYRDYQYVPASTSLVTTPFEIYAKRKGVCQDFANLFICLARLLSIPARYRMGYIHTGANYLNKIQSEASHAWVEVYLPYVGWRGFDPTNGCMVQQDHVRVACGRNFRDATPTSGTIYKGGGIETLSVDVKMQELYD